MASSRDRQRKLARAKLDRQMARRAAQLRRRRQLQAGAGAVLAVVLITVGAVWLSGGFDSDPTSKPTDARADSPCPWVPQSADSNTELKAVGTPPTTGIPTSGSRPMTITTNQGAPIVVSLDLAAAPCGGADLAYLAGKKFYDNTSCHEIIPDGALRCGDPSGTGLGGPTYSIFTENEPTAPDPEPSGAPKKPAPPLFPKGTVALIGNPPGTNGSQFLIFFKDASPKDSRYSIVGKVTSGMDTLMKISKIPTVDNNVGAKVKPKTQILVQSLTVGEVAGATPAGAASPGPSASSQS